MGYPIPRKLFRGGGAVNTRGANAIGRPADRNYGIDFLRLVSMYMVVILHVLGHGGILSATTGCKHHLAWFLETAAYCAVDCYAIISGFVSYKADEKPYKYAKYLGFWVQVLTYHFGITLLAFLIDPASIGARALVRAFFPVTTGAYWYVGAYTGLFFLIPWLNKLMRSLDAKDATRLISLVFIVFVVYPTFSGYFGDCFKLGNGYSFVWITILYLIGAWMKKCDLPKRIKSSRLLLGSAVCIVLSWFASEFLSVQIFVSYTSFTIVFVAISLVSVFSKLQISSGLSKVIAFFAPAAFGVYLIHDQSLVSMRFMSSAFIWVTDHPAYLLPVLVILSAFCVFAICLLIEKARLVLFKLLHIDQLIHFVEKKLEHLLNRISEKTISRS